MFISEVAYELYKQNWIDTHITPEMRLKALRKYYQYVDECLGNTEPYDSFEDWIYEQGYEGGILYVSFDEFLDNEFQDKEYMKELLSYVVFYADYLLDLEHMNKEELK